MPPSSRSTPAPQSSLFRTPAASDLITAHCDGGARGNPGPAGYGAEITDSAGNVIAELSEFLGIRTNNFAEYSGLLASLEYAIDHGHRNLRVISDSELMVKQIQGKYKVNSPDLKPLWQEARNRISRLDHFEITHALRHKNKAADRLANQAMDRGMKRGPESNDRGMKRGPESNDRGMRRDTPAEGKPTLKSPDPRLTSTGGVQSLPLRAIPYPQKSAAPPEPANLDPLRPATSRPPSTRPERSEMESPPHSRANPSTPPPIPVISRPERADAPVPGSSTEPTSQAQPAMLRGFARDGVIHILGSGTLPNGTFVKIIPE